MRTTASKSPARSSRYGQARRSQSNSADSSHSWQATSATICWASTSSGAERNFQRIEFAAADAIEQGHAFDEVVARLREQAPLRGRADRMSRATDALQQCRDRAWRAELADQVDVADVDAEFERRRGHQHFQITALEALLGVEAQLLGQTAVVGGDTFLAEAFAEMARRALGHAPRVDEDQGRAMRLDELGEAVVDRFPDLVRHHRLERHRRHLDGEIARAHMAAVDDRAIGHALRIDMAGADEEARDFLDRLLRGRQADAGQPALAQRLEPLQRQRQMAAALVVGNRMDLVDDHAARAGQHQASGFRAEQQVQRFGRGDENLRRSFQHALAFGCRRIAGAHACADFEIAESAVAPVRHECRPAAASRLIAMSLDSAFSGET